MRHVAIDDLLQSIFATSEGKKDKKRLEKAHQTVTKRPVNNRAAHIDANGVQKKLVKGRSAYIDDNGATKWTPLKNQFTAILGNKCWYTEAELVGASLTIDHYRPKCDYWFLAFKADNYRVACPFANSPKHNEEHGCAGGKRDRFPLLDPSKKATGIQSIKHEQPVILDPCNEDDCKLIAFQSDGRPVLHPDYMNDPIAVNRVNQSKLLLNLDHPHFNTKREQLCRDIDRDVKSYLNSAHDPTHQKDISDSLASKITKTAPFSTAARQYLCAYRNHEWIADLLS